MPRAHAAPTNGATLARLIAMQDPVAHAARLADLDAMIAQMRRLPSLPEMARLLTGLRQDLTALTARVATLERECQELRQGELLRFWDADGEPGA